jgi:Na+:H+ antiporter, NhaA family
MAAGARTDGSDAGAGLSERTTAERVRAFIQHEATAGFVLVLAAVAAIIVENTPGLRSINEQLLSLPVRVSIGEMALAKPLLLWINDGLMAIFFFLAGLEIKREVFEGSLSERDQIVLPVLAALGGMAAPALIYGAINWNDAQLMRGWAIPAATDIAFALGALSLAGNRVPLSLKVFLLTLATLDDLGAIVIIALFYTSELSLIALIAAGTGLVGLIALNLAGITRVAPYIFIGLVVWIFVLKSGVHATLAGVAVALTIPLKRKDGASLIHQLEEALHPYVKFLILPFFAFANAGVSFEGFSLATLVEPLAFGIAAGLVVGKPLGILIAVGAAVALGLARLPAGTTWRQIAGVSCLAGIGFTMSLFIGALAFEDAAHTAQVRFGVITASLMSTALGMILLTTAKRRAVSIT